MQKIVPHFPDPGGCRQLFRNIVLLAVSHFRKQGMAGLLGGLFHYRQGVGPVLYNLRFAGDRVVYAGAYAQLVEGIDYFIPCRVGTI